MKPGSAILTLNRLARRSKIGVSAFALVVGLSACQDQGFSFLEDVEYFESLQLQQDDEIKECLILAVIEPTNPLRIPANTASITQVGVVPAGEGCLVKYELNGEVVQETSTNPVYSVVSGNLNSALNNELVAIVSNGESETRYVWNLVKNHAPTCGTTLPSQSVVTSAATGQGTTLFVAGNDTDDDTLTFNWKLDGQSTASIAEDPTDANNPGRRIFTPNSDQVGSRKVTSELYDGYDSVVCSWDFTVAAPPDDCSFTGVVNPMADVASPPALKVSASAGGALTLGLVPQGDGCVVSYEVRYTPIGAEEETLLTNQFSGQTSFEFPNTFTRDDLLTKVRAIVSNGTNTAAYEWKLRKNKLPNCNAAAPAISSTTLVVADVDTPLVTSGAIDPDSSPSLQAPIWRINGQLADPSVLLPVAGNPYAKTFDPPNTNDWMGSRLVSMEVSDGTDSVTCSWNFNVNAAPEQCGFSIPSPTNLSTISIGTLNDVIIGGVPVGEGCEVRYYRLANGASLPANNSIALTGGTELQAYGVGFGYSVDRSVITGDSINTTPIVAEVVSNNGQPPYRHVWHFSRNNPPLCVAAGAPPLSNPLPFEQTATAIAVDVNTSTSIEPVIQDLDLAETHTYIWKLDGIQTGNSGQASGGYLGPVPPDALSVQTRKRYTPTSAPENQAGVHYVSVDVSDGKDLSSCSWKFSVTDPDLLQSLTFTNITPGSDSTLIAPHVQTSADVAGFVRDQTYTANVQGVGLKYQWVVTSPSGATSRFPANPTVWVNATGSNTLRVLWSGATDVANQIFAMTDPGIYTITAYVRDGGYVDGGPAGHADQKTIYVRKNVVPAIGNSIESTYPLNSSARFLNVDATMDFRVDGSDANSTDILSYTWRIDGAESPGILTSPDPSQPQRMRLDPAGDLDWVGTHTITVTVSDQKESVSRSWEVDINRFSQECNRMIMGQGNLPESAANNNGVARPGNSSRDYACTIAGKVGVGNELNPELEGTEFKLNPRQIIFDSVGNAYISDSLNHSVWFWNRKTSSSTTSGAANTAPAGSCSPDCGKWVLGTFVPYQRMKVVAGTGVRGYSTGSSGIVPLKTSMNSPSGLVLLESDPDYDRLYVADTNNHRVIEFLMEKSTRGSNATEIIPPPSEGSSIADGIAATSSSCLKPSGMVMLPDDPDTAGGGADSVLLIACKGSNAIRKIELSSLTVSTFIGQRLPSSPVAVNYGKSARRISSISVNTPAGAYTNNGVDYATLLIDTQENHGFLLSQPLQLVVRSGNSPDFVSEGITYYAVPGGLKQLALVYAPHQTFTLSNTTPTSLIASAPVGSPVQGGLSTDAEIYLVPILPPTSSVLISPTANNIARWDVAGSAPHGFIRGGAVVLRGGTPNPTNAASNHVADTRYFMSVGTTNSNHPSLAYHYYVFRLLANLSDATEILPNTGTSMGTYIENIFDGFDRNLYASALSGPVDLKVDGAGNLYFNEETGCRVRRLSATTGKVDVMVGGRQWNSCLSLPVPSGALAEGSAISSPGYTQSRLMYGKGQGAVAGRLYSANHGLVVGDTIRFAYAPVAAPVPSPAISIVSAYIVSAVIDSNHFEIKNGYGFANGTAQPGIISTNNGFTFRKAISPVVRVRMTQGSNVYRQIDQDGSIMNHGFRVGDRVRFTGIVNTGGCNSNIAHTTALVVSAVGSATEFTLGTTTSFTANAGAGCASVPAGTLFTAHAMLYSDAQTPARALFGPVENHGLQNGDIVRLAAAFPASGTLGTSRYNVGVDYYVVNVDGNRFQLASMMGGTPLIATNNFAALQPGIFLSESGRLSNGAITFTTNMDTDRLTAINHGLSGGQTLSFTSTAQGLMSGNPYWVKSVIDANTIEVASGPTADVADLIGNGAITAAVLNHEFYPAVFPDQDAGSSSADRVFYSDPFAQVIRVANLSNTDFEYALSPASSNSVPLGRTGHLAGLINSPGFNGNSSASGVLKYANGARMTQPSCITRDPEDSDHLLVCDGGLVGGLSPGGPSNMSVRKLKIEPDASIVRENSFWPLLGNRQQRLGHLGDMDSSANSIQLYQPQGLAFDPSSESLFIADRMNHRVREVNQYGVARTVVIGNFGGACGPALSYPATSPVSDDEIPTMSTIQEPAAIIKHGSAYLIADRGRHTIRIWNPTDATVTMNGISVPPGRIYVVAGTSCNPSHPLLNPAADSNGTNALDVSLNGPEGLASDGVNFYIADTGNHCVRRVNGSGAIETVAGLCGEGGQSPINSLTPPALGVARADSRLYRPTSVAVDKNEPAATNSSNFASLFIADTYNDRVLYLNMRNTTVSFRTGVSVASGYVKSIACQNGAEASTNSTRPDLSACERISSVTSYPSLSGNPNKISDFCYTVEIPTKSEIAGLGAPAVRCVNMDSYSQSIVFGRTDSDKSTGIPLGYEFENARGTILASDPEDVATRNPTARPRGITYDPSKRELYISDESHTIRKLILHD